MGAVIVEPTLPRMLPRLTDQNRAFWTGGAAGRLLILRCRACRRWTHPPVDRCPSCGGSLVPEPVSGRGTVFTFTVNMHQFHPDVPPPNIIAIVELAEQQDLRIPTNLVRVDAAELHCGLDVQVLFEHHGEVYYPIFEPAGAER
ncbi:MAG: Zn-ribbon domain-containing OB-fold protein [Acidimicrobiales bacterium]